MYSLQDSTSRILIRLLTAIGLEVSSESVKLDALVDGKPMATLGGNFS